MISMTVYTINVMGSYFSIDSLLQPYVSVLCLFFSSYRYAFGIVICSISLVTILLVLIGVACGMIGFRKSVDPTERSGLSHCGGIFLLMYVTEGVESIPPIYPHTVQLHVYGKDGLHEGPVYRISTSTWYCSQMQGMSMQVPSLRWASMIVHNHMAHVIILPIPFSAMLSMVRERC